MLGVDLLVLQARLVESRDRIAAGAGIATDWSWRPPVR
jgi:5-methylthioadenosine/S-adenosylhomocysteine deaminase